MTYFPWRDAMATGANWPCWWCNAPSSGYVVYDLRSVCICTQCWETVVPLWSLADVVGA